MRPVQHFKSNFDQPAKEGMATDNQAQTSVNGIHTYDDDSTVRNLCFVWEDGRKAFFNYAYLVSVDFFMQDSINILLLSFGSYTVSLKGYNLGLLFDLLLNHTPKTVTANNPRYISDKNGQESLVIEIIVKSD